MSHMRHRHTPRLFAAALSVTPPCASPLVAHSTINGFWMEEYETNPSQPSPKWLADLRVANPAQPAIWTEDQGWFDQWQVAKRVREPTDQIYGIARWFAFGGSWHNFYMLTGG
jgi:hypothetical protein